VFSNMLSRWPSRVILVCTVLSYGCPSMCGNREIVRVTSPSGRLDAVLFERSCGATTGFSTQVAVVPVGKPLADVGGNVYVADDDHGKAPVAGWGGPPARIEWRDGQSLIVHYARESRVFEQARALRVKTGWFEQANVSGEFIAE